MWDGSESAGERLISKARVLLAIRAPLRLAFTFSSSRGGNRIPVTFAARRRVASKMATLPEADAKSLNPSKFSSGKRLHSVVMSPNHFHRSQHGAPHEGISIEPCRRRRECNCFTC